MLFKLVIDSDHSGPKVQAVIHRVISPLASRRRPTWSHNEFLTMMKTIAALRVSEWDRIAIAVQHRGKMPYPSLLSAALNMSLTYC